MKTFLIFSVLLINLTGCGLSTFTQRETDPYIRDVLFNMTQPVSVMVTDASRRLIYEFDRKDGKTIYCADAPPDSSIMASGSLGGDVTANIPTANPSGTAEGSLSVFRASSSSVIPLLRRSQGLQWGRDNAARQCMLYAMEIITKDEYIKALQEIRKTAKEIIEKELATLGVLTLPTSIVVPASPVIPKKQ